MLHAVAPLLAALLLVLGSVASYRLALQPLATAWRARTWVEVPAVLDRVAYVDGYTAQLQISYHYWRDDRMYMANRYGVHDGLDEAGRLRDVAATLYRKQRIRAWVNPAEADEAVLDRSPHWGVVLLAVPALLLALAGAGLLWLSVRGWLCEWQAGRRLARYREGEE